MCRGEGQVLRRGLEIWCGGGGALVASARISLMEEVLPSRFVAFAVVAAR